MLRRVLDAWQGEHLGIARQVVEQGRGFIEKQWQVVLDAGRCNSAAQVLKNRAAAEVDIKALSKACLEAGHGVFLQGELACRQQSHRFDLVDRALVFRIEGAQGFDFVVEQVDPVGQFAAHREQVDQCAANGEFAVFVDRIDAAITAGLKPGAHLLHVQLLADIQDQAAAEQKFGRRQAM